MTYSVSIQGGRGWMKFGFRLKESTGSCARFALSHLHVSTEVGLCPLIRPCLGTFLSYSEHGRPCEGLCLQIVPQCRSLHRSVETRRWWVVRASTRYFSKLSNGARPYRHRKRQDPMEWEIIIMGKCILFIVTMYMSGITRQIALLSLITYETTHHLYHHYARLDINDGLYWKCHISADLIWYSGSDPHFPSTSMSCIIGCTAI